MNILPLHSKQCAHCATYYSEVEQYCPNCGLHPLAIQLANQHFGTNKTHNPLLEDLKKLATLDKKQIEKSLKIRIEQAQKRVYWGELKRRQDPGDVVATLIATMLFVSILLFMNLDTMRGENLIIITILSVVSFLFIFFFPNLREYYYQNFIKNVNTQDNFLVKYVFNSEYAKNSLTNPKKTYEHLIDVLQYVKFDQMVLSYAAEKERILQNIWEINEQIEENKVGVENAQKGNAGDKVVELILAKKREFLIEKEKMYAQMQAIEELQWRKMGLDIAAGLALENTWLVRKEKGEYVAQEMVQELKQDIKVRKFQTVYESWLSSIQVLKKKYAEMLATKLDTSLGEEIGVCMQGAKNVVEHIEKVNDARVNKQQFQENIARLMNELNEMNLVIYTAQPVKKSLQYFDDELNYALEKSRILFDLMIEDKNKEEV